MSGDLRARLRNAVSEASRVQAKAWVREHGCDSCDFCGHVIDPAPRRRFCSEDCRKRWSWFNKVSVA